MCATDRDSLGTTHCGSAILKMRDMYGRVLDGFIQGCINCAGKISPMFFFYNQGYNGQCAQDPQLFKKNRRKRRKTKTNTTQKQKQKNVPRLQVRKPLSLCLSLQGA